MQVLLAKKWSPDTDPKGYFISEKLDGVRAVWDGKNLVSRNGNVFHAPATFKALLPNAVLDGELWVGRKSFQETMSIVATERCDKGWNRVGFMVFDAPALTGARFERRQDELKRIVSGSSICTLVPQLECLGRDHLYKVLDEVINVGGEGLMLRRPGSLYENKRSSSLLKVKRFIDAEALVVGHAPGKGKYTGALGALMCVLDDGTEFEIGTGFSDEQRINSPPPVGCKVNFKYGELSRDGVPRFPVFVRVRKPE